MPAIHFRRCAHAPGFTLLELLIAFAIFGLLLAVATPSGLRMYENMQYRGAVSDVFSTLTMARVAAISRGDSLDVVINPEARMLSVGDTQSRLPDNVTLRVLGARELNREDAGVIRFYPDGSSSGGAVGLVSEQGKETEVQVDWLLGSVSLCKNDCGTFR
jgi:general secretion pathway protein H